MEGHFLFYQEGGKRYVQLDWKDENIPDSWQIFLVDLVQLIKNKKKPN